MLLNNKLSHSIKAGRRTKLASPLQPFPSSGLSVPNVPRAILLYQPYSSPLFGKFPYPQQRYLILTHWNQATFKVGEEHLSELGQLGVFGKKKTTDQMVHWIAKVLECDCVFEKQGLWHEGSGLDP